jgi:hypothetical protein
MIPVKNPYCKERADLLRRIEQDAGQGKPIERLQARLEKVDSLSLSYVLNVMKKEGRGGLSWSSQKELASFQAF